MHLDDLDIAVVGGGIGGSAAALLLGRAGARVTLLERVADPRAVGAGIALAANGLAVLDSLGLGPALAVARSVPGARVVDGSGRTLLAPPAPPPRMLLLRRATLQAILHDALAAEPRVERRFGAEVERADPDGTVILRTAEGTRLLRASLVVGADGVHSRVRDGGRFGASVRHTGITYARALVPAGLARTEEAWTAAGVFGSFPVDDGTYLFASAGSRACRAALAARDLEAFRRAWARAYPPAGDLLAAVPAWDDLLLNEVLCVEAERWHDGRLVLLGDAAHAMAPNLGQGANSALVDAAVLLDELRRAPDVSRAAAAYEARRRPAVQRVAQLARRLGVLAEQTSPVARAMRDRVLLPIANRVAGDGSTAMVLQEPPERLLAIGLA